MISTDAGSQIYPDGVQKRMTKFRSSLDLISSVKSRNEGTVKGLHGEHLVYFHTLLWYMLECQKPIFIF